MSAWKGLERRVCALLGGRRAGPTGATSDCVNVPWAVEVKRCTTVRVESRFIVQAKAQSAREGKPWLLVVAGHNDRRPVVCLDLGEFVDIAHDAGRIPREEEVA